MIRSVEKKKILPKVSLILGMQMLVAAWDEVTTKTIFESLKDRVKVRKPSKAEDDPFKDSEEEIERNHVQFNWILFQRK